MREVAGVIIISKAKELDRLFDYYVPEGKKVFVGSRVFVPFGRGNNSVEGFVLKIRKAEDEKSDELKEIDRVFEKKFFDENGAQLIEEVRKKTLCTYAEAVALLIPAGYKASFSEAYELDFSVETEKYRAFPIYKRIIEALKGGKMSLESIEKSFGKDGLMAVKALTEKKVLIKTEINKENVSEAMDRYLELADEKTADKALEELPKNARKQAKVILYLMANGKLAPFSEVLRETEVSPAVVGALIEKGIVKNVYRRRMRSPISQKCETSEEFLLTDEQKKVYGAVSEAIDDGRFEKFLLYGVTGSGKTEVFIRAVKKCLEMNKTAIVLVPEISLTPLMTKRFTSRFSGEVAILHSRLSKGERLDEWDKINSGKAKVVLGARSAVFAPLKNIGIIIIDEEHEQSYKADKSPRYHARDIAFLRAEQNNAIVIMASATPLVESYYKATTGEYKLLEMKERYNKNPLPEVVCVDMREELKAGNMSIFSDMLASEIDKNRINSQQSIILLNRRGFSTFVSCRECGFVAQCPHCSISLTYHKRENVLNCHYCGYTIKNYTACPTCGSRYIKYFGSGTQKLEEELASRFSDLKILRMDFDTTTKKGSHLKIIESFEKREADVLVGTQMVSKGHDFENVTLAAVLCIDTSLYIDDYRSAEKTFALIEQVSGRAGRKALKGRAIIQTYCPENSVIVHAKNHDYTGFYKEEIKLRKIMGYPPFCEITSILLTGENEEEIFACITRMANWLKKRTKEREDILLLGPAKSAIGKIKDKFRYQIIIKHKDGIDDIARETVDAFIRAGYNKTMTLVVDHNPSNL